MNKAIIGISPGQTAFWEDWQRIAQAIDAGETFPEQGDYYLSFASMSQLFAVLTPTCWSVLHTVQTTGPLSLAVLAQRLSLPADQVQAVIATLREYNLVEETNDGSLIVPWATIELHLTTSTRQAA